MKFVLQLPSSELMRTMAHFGAMLHLPILLVSPLPCSLSPFILDKSTGLTWEGQGRNRSGIL